MVQGDATKVMMLTLSMAPESGTVYEPSITQYQLLHVEQASAVQTLIKEVRAPF